MVIFTKEIAPKLTAYYPGKRMPMLYAFNRSFGRKIISEPNEEVHEKGIRSEILDVNDIGASENYLTCMAISDDGIAAIGSGNKQGSLYFIRDKSAIKDVESGKRFQPLHKETMGLPIYSLDWSGNHLLLGSKNGIIRLYKIVFEGDRLNEFKLLSQYTNSPSENQINSLLHVSNSHVKSAEFISTYDSNVSSVSDLFLSTMLNQISIWDPSISTSPLFKLEPTTAPLLCASWSPNEPQSLIVCGGYDKCLSIVDTRVDKSQCVVWSVEKAHDRAIHDAKFNTFIPYWLASGGEDSIVNIWDIRSSYKAPVAKIDGHIGIVTSITWSNIRPENLATTASDGTMRHWSLCPEIFPLWDTFYKTATYSHQDTLPMCRKNESSNAWCTRQQCISDENDPKSWSNIWSENEDMLESRSTVSLVGSIGLGSWGTQESGFIYKGEKIAVAKGSVVSVKASKLRPCTYYSISSGGQFVSHTIIYDTASHLRNRHRFDPADKNELAAEIEDAIYCRRISKARTKLNILKHRNQNDDNEERLRQEEIEFLEDCLQLRDPIKESDWSFDSILNKADKRVSRRLWNDDEMWEYVINNFKNDLKYWSYRIPPGFSTQYKFPLNFNGPTIAEHLIKKEKIKTELPSMTDDFDSFGSSEDLNAQVVPQITENENMVNDEIKNDKYNENSDNYILNNRSIDEEKISDTKKEIEEARPKYKFELMDESDENLSLPSLKERRNMNHVPSIPIGQNKSNTSINQFSLTTPPDGDYPYQNNFEINNTNAYLYSPASLKSIPDYDALQISRANRSFEGSRSFELARSEHKITKSSSQTELSIASKSKNWVARNLNISQTFGTEKHNNDDSKSEKGNSKFNVFRKKSKGKKDKVENKNKKETDEKVLEKYGNTIKNAIQRAF